MTVMVKTTTILLFCVKNLRFLVIFIADTKIQIYIQYAPKHFWGDILILISYFFTMYHQIKTLVLIFFADTQTDGFLITKISHNAKNSINDPNLMRSAKEPAKIAAEMMAKVI